MCLFLLFVCLVQFQIVLFHHIIIYYIILHILLLTLKGYFLMRDGKEDVQEPDEVDKGKAIITIYYMEKIYFH